MQPVDNFGEFYGQCQLCPEDTDISKVLRTCRYYCNTDENNKPPKNVKLFLICPDCLDKLHELTNKYKYDQNK